MPVGNRRSGCFPSLARQHPFFHERTIVVREKVCLKPIYAKLCEQRHKNFKHAFCRKAPVSRIAIKAELIFRTFCSQSLRNMALVLKSRFFTGATICSIHKGEMVGLRRFELLTSRLSSVRSNQLSYRPFMKSWERDKTRAVCLKELKISSAIIAHNPLSVKNQYLRYQA